MKSKMHSTVYWLNFILLFLKFGLGTTQNIEDKDCHLFYKWNEGDDPFTVEELILPMTSSASTFTIIGPVDMTNSSERTIALFMEEVMVENSIEVPPSLQKLQQDPCVIMNLIHTSTNPEQDIWSKLDPFQWYKYLHWITFIFWTDQLDYETYPDVLSEMLSNILFVNLKDKGVVYYFNKGYTDNIPAIQPISKYENAAKLFSSPPQPPKPFNFNRKKVEIGGVKVVDYCDKQRNPRTRRRAGACTEVHFMLFTLRKMFNMTLKTVKEDFRAMIFAERPKIKIYEGPIPFDLEVRQYMVLSLVGSPPVFYCRPNPRLGSNWKVWFSPFRVEVWVIIPLIFLVPALRKVKSGMDAYLKEVFLIFSYSLYRPERPMEMNIAYAKVALLTPIIAYAYEGVITGKVIVRDRAPVYDDVRKLVATASYKIYDYSNSGLHGAAGSQKYAEENSTGFRHEFDRFKISHLFTNESYVLNEGGPNPPWRKFKDEGMLTKERNAVSFAAPGSLEIYHIRLAVNETEDYPCDWFPLEEQQFGYNTFMVPFAPEAISAFTRLWEAGISDPYHGHWTELSQFDYKLWIFGELRKQRLLRGTGPDKYITLRMLYNLKFVFFILFCIGVSVVCFSMENGTIGIHRWLWRRKARRFLKRYPFLR